MPIDPLVLTERMGLSVQMRHITPELTIFGEIFYEDCEAEYYDKEQESMQKAPVRPGTIFVDPDAYYLLNLGFVNNTIVHECVHWGRHRKAFELERLYNKEATQIKCLVVGGVKDRNARTAADWMEWQANLLAPRILMSFAQAKIKAEELMGKYKRRFPNYELIDIMEPVIDKLAKFLNVSRLSAKIRMIELGYEEAVRTFTYIDGRYVRPHSFTKGHIRKNQTFSISERDAIIESFMNKDLQEKIQSGRYLFVDAHFCINAAEYITTDHKDRPCLTKYARHHIDECCPLFDLSVQKSANAYGQAYYGECALFRGAIPEIVFEVHYSDSKINDDVEAKAKVIAAYIKELSEVLQNLPGSFSGSLKALMEWTDISVEALAEASGLVWVSPRQWSIKSSTVTITLRPLPETARPYGRRWRYSASSVIAHSFLVKTEIAEFSDDGHTGTSFDRPAMKPLLEKAKCREFGCILVKDTSRFGSNYIEISEYLEKIFPFLGVRFISVNDGYDSEDYKGQTTPMNIAFGSIMHDIYSRDLSLKVTQSNISKAKKGEFFCGVVPFGFMKSKTVKNKLEIDEKAAQTMRKIFSLACENYSTGEIAALLNEKHVPTSLAYRKQNGLKPVGNHAAVYERWVSAMVRRILRDERYIGVQVGESALMLAAIKQLLFHLRTGFVYLTPMSELYRTRCSMRR